MLRNLESQLITLISILYNCFPFMKGRGCVGWSVSTTSYCRCSIGPHHGPDSACEIDGRLGHRQTTLDLAGRGGVVRCEEEGKSAGNVALAKVTPRIPAAAVQTQRSADGSGHLIFKTPPLSLVSTETICSSHCWIYRYSRVKN